MIPLLLAAGRTALASGRVMSTASKAKNITSVLKARGYISNAGRSARQMARIATSPRGKGSAFKNPYTFSKSADNQQESGTVDSSTQETSQSQNNTKKQTLIISADNVFLRTSQAIMESAMPAAPENIERASGTTGTSLGDLLKKFSPSSDTVATGGFILGKLLYKVFDTIFEKITGVFATIKIAFMKSLSTILRFLGFSGRADKIDEEIQKETTPPPAPTTTQPSEAATATTPAVSPAPVATGYTPAVTPTTPTSPKSTYAAPSGFFGAPTLGTAKTTDSAMPIITGNMGSIAAVSSVTPSTIKKSTSEAAKELITGKEGFSAKAYPDPSKKRQDEKNAERKKEGKPPLPYTYSIGFGHQIRQDEIAQGFINLGDEKIPVKGEGGKDTIIPGTKEEAEIRAGKLLSIDLPKYMSSAKKYIGEQAWNKLTGNQQAVLTSYSYNTGSTKSLKEHGLTEAIMKGDTTAAGNIIAEKGIRTARGKIDTGLVERRKEEGLMFIQDTINPKNLKPATKMKIKPQSSAGSLSTPTQATGRNIEMTSQILKSAPSVTNTAQNTQPVVINNINAPTVASGGGSSGSAIQMSVFRNTDNSIMANANKHLRAGILGV